MVNKRIFGLCTGEEGPADYIWQALKDLKAQRIDHGVHCIEDSKLVDYLVEHEVALTVCPLSNLKVSFHSFIQSLSLDFRACHIMSDSLSCQIC